MIQYTIKTLEKLKLFSLNVCLGLAKVIDQRMRMGELFLILCLESLIQGQEKERAKKLSFPFFQIPIGHHLLVELHKSLFSFFVVVASFGELSSCSKHVRSCGSAMRFTR